MERRKEKEKKGDISSVKMMFDALLYILYFISFLNLYIIRLFLLY